MSYSNLNLSRKWFVNIANEISNEANDHLNDLNSYKNIGTRSMQIASDCTRNCCEALNFVINICDDSSIEMDAFENKITPYFNQMVENVCLLKPLVDEDSQAAINTTKKLVQKAYDKIELLLKYAKCEQKGRLKKDKNGNLKCISFRKSLALWVVEHYKFVFFALAPLFCLLYAIITGDVNGAEQVIEYVKQIIK